MKFPLQIFENNSNIKFHENSFSGTRVVPCGQTDMTKLIVLFEVLRTRLKYFQNFVTMNSLVVTSSFIE